MAKLKEVHTEIVIGSNREKIWDALANQFGNINSYHPETTDSRLTKGIDGEVGSERVCDFGTKMSITEKVIEAKPLELISIDANGFPGVKDILAIFELFKLEEDLTKVEITFNFRTTPAILAVAMVGTMRKKLHQVLVGLKYYVETGKPLNKKQFKGLYTEFTKMTEGTSFI